MGVLPDTEAEGLSRMLRTPAAVIAAAYVGGLLVGEVTRSATAPRTPLAVYLITAFVCAPFLMRVRWFRGQPAVLWAWMFAAAIVATSRVIAMALWLYTRLPFDDWLVKTAGDLFVTALLWLAAVALWRSPVRYAPLR